MMFRHLFHQKHAAPLDTSTKPRLFPHKKAAVTSGFSMQRLFASLRQRQQAGIAAGRRGVDGECAFGGEFQQVMRAASFRAGAR